RRLGGIGEPQGPQPLARRHQGAALHLAPGQVALALEGLEVIVDSVGRADAHGEPDLADGGREALRRDVLGDELENRPLPLRELFHDRSLGFRRSVPPFGAWLTCRVPRFDSAFYGTEVSLNRRADAR